jgi:hypothetical protein
VLGWARQPPSSCDLWTEAPALTYNQFLVRFALGYQEHLSSTSPHLTQKQGQFYYNLLDNLRPDVAKTLRGSEIYPHNTNYVSSQVHNYVESQWGSHE